MFFTYTRPSFRPSQISNLDIWLDANDSSTITQSGGRVSVWADKSGNSANALQGTGASQPTYTANGQNGRSVVTYANGNFFQISSQAATDITSSFTFQAALNMTSATGGGGNILSKGTLGPYRWRFDNNTTNGAITLIIADSDGFSVTTTTTTVSFGVPVILGVRFRAGVAIDFYVNNIQIYTAATTKTVLSTNASAVDVGTVSGSENFIGQMMEVLVYKKALSDVELGQTVNYLSNKWGIPVFTPNMLGGCSLWLDASDATTITKDGSNLVSQWNDKSINGYNATQATGAKQPTYTAAGISGKSVLTFDGTDDYMAANDIASIMSGSDKEATIFLVGTTTSAATTQYPYFFGNSGAANPLLGLKYNSSAFEVVKSDDAGTLLNPSGGTVVSNAVNIQGAVISGTTVDFYQNGTKIINAGNLDVGTTTINNFTIGSANFGGSPALYLSGKIAELIIYNRALSAIEITSVTQYLNAKYSVY
ncbi:Concanavalin A-like lectin/glucanases superfamily [uncultured Caudovirales phage]|uniref:Concanavalin A-like lectin/glucanases superfamily n=1 Tax=uncultured Caudovirales phage TaxID=2100421 RepID=A0A6J5SH19_9CAUD|nr:Concanavalin A-like lectin/glucanases superfamily [uncultured Caudovirales phage]